MPPVRAAGAVTRPPRARRRRARRLRRALPLAAAAGLAFGGGLLVAGSSHRADRRAAERFASAWQRRDWATMYGLLDADSRARVSRAAFARAYEGAWSTATVTGLDAGRARRPHDGRVPVAMVVRTRVFGTLHPTLELPVADGRVAWRRELVFPGLRPGERLTRSTALPARAAILARDGTPLAAGRQRTSPVPAVAGQVVGTLGAPPARERPRRRAEGYPPTALVGVNGLERAFQDELAGRPGGDLRAGDRLLARSRPRAGRAVRTTIDVRLERAAIASLAGRLGGAAAVDPRTGAVRALAGLAYSALQPPGSTFKIITTAGALEAGIVKPTDTFPVRTGATLEGRTLENANGESCGGTFVQSFAQSCNSVFAPLGARLGARRLVAAARAFGFGEPPGIPGAATSSIPSAEAIGDDLAVGASAIGQGRVQATALQMALVAATVATGGIRPRPVLVAGKRRPASRAIPPAVARELRRLMVAVVRGGTGTAAQIPGVLVAGKTGTAELRDTSRPAGAGPTPAPVDTDAWFVAFAPARRARIAVGVLLVEAGGGGAVAAPAARTILQAGLRGR